MKKRIAQSIALVLCLMVLFIVITEYKVDYVQIKEEEVALTNTLGNLVEETRSDTCVIPDKYNTGAHGTLTAITSDCYISGVKFGTTGTTDRKLDLYYQKDEVPSLIVVENCDFSSGAFRFYNADLVEKQTKVVFRNCKFTSYIISGTGKVNHEFYNCTFTHFAGGNATFISCYFGSGTDGDGINPGQNCIFENCMIADLIQDAEVPGEKHIDGFQIFGSTTGDNNSDIILSNCRFEIPAIPLSSPSGAMNCPLSIIMRYSDAENLRFEDCYLNGGKYYALMVNANENSIKNISFNNVHIGESSKSPYTCDAEFNSIIQSGTIITDQLYVASVRKLEDGIHLSVTNDTARDRVLTVATKEGIQKYDIMACPKAIDLAMDSVKYEDFPFDIDIVIPNTEWVVCYDTTDFPEQIRYVNWTNEAVYVNLEDLVPDENSTELEENTILSSQTPMDNVETSVPVTTDSDDTKSMICQGTCGDNVEYCLENGVLTLTGNGTTYNYHSGMTTPWYDYKLDIKEAVIGEGITGLGNQLFADCSNLTRVNLPEGLLWIGKNVFKRCSSLVYISIPKTIISIGERSFTSSVCEVYYGGSIESWNDVQIGNYNQGLLDAKMQYADNERVVYSGMCGDNTKWTLTSKGCLTISGEGATYNYHSGQTPPWYEHALDIHSIIIEEGVTTIGNFFFRDCANVKNVNLPAGIRSIGINAFSRCKELQEITFTSSVTSIGKNAFAGTNISAIYYYGTYDEWNQISTNPLQIVKVVFMQ